MLQAYKIVLVLYDTIFCVDLNISCILFFNVGLQFTRHTYYLEMKSISTYFKKLIELLCIIFSMILGKRRESCLFVKLNG